MNAGTNRERSLGGPGRWVERAEETHAVRRLVAGGAGTLALIALALAGCPHNTELACPNMTSAECVEKCARFTTCSECAAQPDCGWCGPHLYGQGSCIPALLGQDRRNEKPETCNDDWYFRARDSQTPDQAPFCPAIPPED
jgi:hypothetical protein